MTATPATAPASQPPTSRRSPARHWLVQNTPLVLSFVILAITLSAWVFFYHGQLGRFPDNFDVTQVTNSSLPLVFAAVGYGATRGRRDFTSASQMVAGRYDVLCQPRNAEKARELLAKLARGPGATPA